MFIVAAVGLTFQIAAAGEPTDHRVNISSTKTIRITADKLIAEINAAEVEFLGNVKAQQSGTVITANRLIIVYDRSAVNNKGNSPKTDAIRKIIARGRVRIVYNNIVAEGDSAEYTIKFDIFVLTGKPSRVSRDGDLITGSKFTLQRSDGTLTVEGLGQDRVRAIFHTD
ncbi:MAG: LptA/OstA family protein [Desulfobacterales bacterium]|jgi:lipopolysaccharide transport protein LptA